MIIRPRLLVLPAVAIACGTEPPGPGELAISLDAVPPAVASTSVALTGTVTRTPALAVPIGVRAVGGQAAVEEQAGSDGGFALDVQLAPNTVSTITVSAWDSTGSTSGEAAVQVRQDSRGPAVLSVSPAHAATGVALDHVVVVTFDEPVNPAVPAITSVRRGGRTIPFGATLAPDNLSLTVTPGERAAGAIYQVVVGGLQDAVGNVQSVTLNACYATAPPAGTSVIADPANDWYYGGELAGLTPSDFLGASFVVTGALTDVLLRFSTARAVAASGANAVFGVLDLDYDLRDDTGWQSFKDYVFGGVLPPSHVGAEHAIVLASIPELGDSSFFGRYVELLTIQPLGTFVPVACGTTIGFALENAALAPPAAFHLVSYFETGNQNGVFADPAPDGSYYVVDLPPQPAAPAAAAAARALRPPGGRIRLPARPRF
jgi:hypothetical protein